MPVEIWKYIEQIQQRILWGDTDDSRRIHWVGWNQVCKSIGIGDLGVKKIKYFNLALMTKWRWRILVERGNTCSYFLRKRYGNITHQTLTGESRSFKIPKSSWWKYLIKLRKRNVLNDFDFVGNVK